MLPRLRMGNWKPSNHIKALPRCPESQSGLQETKERVILPSVASHNAEPPLHCSSASVRLDEHLGACLFSQAKKLADANVLQHPVVPRLHSHGPISSASLAKYTSLCREKETAGFMSVLTAYVPCSRNAFKLLMSPYAQDEESEWILVICTHRG